MKVYLAHSGDINKHGHQDYDLIGVYQDKDMAIQAIEQSMTDVNMEYIAKETTPSGNMFWTEYGSYIYHMDIVTVGYLEVRDLL